MSWKSDSNDHDEKFSLCERLWMEPRKRIIGAPQHHTYIFASGIAFFKAGNTMGPSVFQYQSAGSFTKPSIVSAPKAGFPDAFKTDACSLTNPTSLRTPQGSADGTIPCSFSKLFGCTSGYHGPF